MPSKRSTLFSPLQCFAFFCACAATLASAQIPWDISVSAAADSGFVDTSQLSGLEAYARVQTAGGSYFTRDGIAVMQAEGDSFRFYEMRKPLGRLRPWPPLPFRISMAAAATHAPNGRILIGRDTDGDEQFRLFAYEPRKGLAREWPMPSGRASSIRVSPGSRYFAYAFTPSGSRYWDIRRGTWGKVFEDTVVLREAGVWAPFDIDSSGREILLARTVSAFHSELYTLSLPHRPAGPATIRDLRRLPPLENASTVSWAQWVSAPSPGHYGKVALLADGAEEFTRLYLWDGSQGDSLRALSLPCACEVEQALVLPGSNGIAYSLNRRGISELYLVDLKTGMSHRMEGLPEGLLEHWQADAEGKRLLTTFANFSTPGNSFVVDLNRVRQGQTAATLWLKAKGLDQLPMPRFRVQTPRRLEVTPNHPLPPPQQKIPSWLVLPDTDSVKAMVMHLHGGPELQARPSWDAFDRYMTEQWGVAFAYPDVRGSTGYGRAYQAADDQGRRFKVIGDVASLFDTLKTWPMLQTARSALLGRSYGGYLTQASAINLYPRFASAISQVGISDFPLFLSQTSPYRADLRRMEYGDERDSTQRVFLDSLSPLRRMDRLRVPILFVHGLHDPRVPYSQSFMAYQSLLSRDAPAILMTQRSEGHAARAEQTRLAQMRLMAQFLIKSLHIPPH